MLIYFEYKQTLILMHCLTGVLMALLRVYLLVMFINFYSKANVFAFAYLISILVFWFSPLHFYQIRNINKIAIIILVLQYLVLLLAIDEHTSSLPLPNNTSLSILSYFISSEEWIQYLLVGDVPLSQTINAFFDSFVVSSILILMTELYFSAFLFHCGYVTRLMQRIYDRYQAINLHFLGMPVRDTVYLNYHNYKSLSYRLIRMGYELLLNNSSIFVAMMLLFLLTGVYSYLSLVIVFLTCVYIYIGIFTELGEEPQYLSYTVLFFKLIRALLILIITLATIAKVPVFSQTNQAVE